MYRQMKNYTLLVLLFAAFCTKAQTGTGMNAPSKVKNYSNFEKRTYSNEIGTKYNESNLDHPDFGKLTSKAPFEKNVVEVIAKRQMDERYYVDIDEPNFFYIEKSAMPINYLDNGEWKAIDAQLSAVSPILYSAPNQVFPTTLDIIAQEARINYYGEELGFANYSLKVTHFNGNVETLTANWNDYTVGNDGAYITNLFPNVDMTIDFQEGKVKTNLIVQQNLGVKSIELIDHLNIPSNLNLSIESLNPELLGHAQLIDATNNEVIFDISPLNCWDESSSKSSWHPEYFLENNNLFATLDSSMLNANSTVYPLTIDPLITAVGPVAGAQFGSAYAPAICSRTVNLVFPGGSQPWDFSASWDITSNNCGGGFGQCWSSDQQVYFSGGAGGTSPAGAPSVIWGCIGAACFNPGTWNPVLAYNTEPGQRAMVQNYAPSCANQNMSYTMNFNRSYCPFGAYGCNYASNTCSRVNSWSVTIQGRTVEVLGNTATGNGTQNITSASCSVPTNHTLDPNPEHGVPGYTYTWSPGGQTTPTINVTLPPQQTYVCTVRDNCGTTRTATFNLNCPLPVELVDFYGQHFEGVNELFWSTASELNSSHFIIEKSRDGENWTVWDQTKGQGNTSQVSAYKMTDADLEPIVNYYKLIQVDNDGQQAELKIISIDNRENVAYLIKRVNTAGQEVGLDYKGLVIEYYSDGSTQKVIQ